MYEILVLHEHIKSRIVRCSNNFVLWCLYLNFYILISNFPIVGPIKAIFNLKMLTVSWYIVMCCVCVFFFNYTCIFYY